MLDVLNYLPKKYSNVAVSLMGTDEKEILAHLSEILTLQCDVIEWRLDYFALFTNVEKVLALYKSISAELNKTKLLLTLRTTREGGRADISDELYRSLIKDYLLFVEPDMIDIEFMRIGAQNSLQPLLNKLTSLPILSVHQFNQALTLEEMTTLVDQMSISYPNAIYKLATMPQSFSDVVDMLELSAKNNGERPLILISMGNLGKVTRVLTDSMKCVLTFASIGQSSAPGQIDLTELKDLLTKLST